MRKFVSLAVMVVVASLLSLLVWYCYGPPEEPPVPTLGLSSPEAPRWRRVTAERIDPLDSREPATLSKQDDDRALEPTLVIKVLGVDGVGIAGAALHAVCHGLSSALGSTNADGSLPVQAQECMGLKIAASALGFGEGSAPASDAVAGILEITLAVEAILDGQLMLEGTPIARQDVSVYAWRSDDRPPSEELLSCPNNMRLRNTKTALDGSFSLRGLTRGVGYTLVAAGNGMVSTSPIGNQRPAIDRPALPVEYVYALSVQVSDQNRKPLRTQDQLYGGGISWPSDIPGMRALGRQEPAVNLLGIPRGQLYGNVQASFLLLGRSAQLRESVGPALVNVAIPGYELVYSEVAIPLHMGGPPQASLIKLDPLPDARWGKIELYMDGLFEPADVSTRGAYVARLRLDDLALGKPIGDLCLWQLAPGLNSFEGIPGGEYKCVFLNKERFDRQPDAESGEWLIVVGEVPAKVHVDASRYGALELLVLNANGTLHAGKLSVMLRPQLIDGEPAANPLYLEKSPYVIPLLPEGVYKVDFLEPRMAVADAMEILIRAGQRLTVTCTKLQ